MDVFDAIRHRRSVRDYKHEPLSRDILEGLIDAATRAPSAMNEQPWRFTVVTDQILLDRISKGAKAHMLEAFADSPRASHFRQMLSDRDFQIFYHAPALIVISAPADGQWVVEDCALAAENLMLAAFGHGLGSCWIGFAQGWLNTQGGRAAIGLSKDETAVAPIIVGHPKAEAPDVPRRKPQTSWIGPKSSS